MYYSSGNYEAFDTPKKPEGVDAKSAYLNKQQNHRLPESGPIAACILHNKPRNANSGG